MQPIERRLTDHLDEQAARIELYDEGVVRVMTEGRRKRNARVALIGVAAGLAVVALAVASIAVFSRKDKDSSITPATPPTRLTLGLPAATQVSTVFDWSVESTDQTATQFGSASWWSGASSNGLSGYTFGTVPHQPDEPAQQQLFATTDGVEYQAVGQPFDPWISSLDSSQPQQVYALGTVAAGLSYSYRAGVSADQGASWQTAEVPVGLDEIREDLGNVSTAGTQVVAGDGSAIAIVQPVTYGGNLTIDGVDTQYGTAISADGLEVYGPPTDLDAVAARECPPGWPLVKGAPREVVSDEVSGTAPASTIVVGPIGSGDAAMWHCESPDRSVADLWIDPTRVHGDVAQVIPFDQLPFGEATVKALRSTVRVFRTTDGTAWTEIELPAGGSTSVRPTLLWTGSEYALRAPGIDGSQLWLSADGETWRQASVPANSDSLAFGTLPDGSFVLAGQQLGELVAYTSSDGTAWSGVSLDGLLALDPTWRVSTIQLVTSPAGVSMMVNATQDPFAALGAPVIDHGRYQLRLPDSRGAAELLDGDGNVLDRVDNVWQGVAVRGQTGTMATTASGGVVVLDPATGDILDSFVQTEISAASDSIWSSDEGQRWQSTQPPGAWWVLDTVDGSSWGVQRVEGLSGSNSWLGTAPQATASTHAYRFMVAGTSTAVVVGRRP